MTAEVAFSVVIPTYNRSSLARRAVMSVLKQSYSAAEIIVVDDGSTDDTKDVFATFPEVILVSQTNAGVSAARNTGVDQASSKWIAFLDSDDVWYQNHLEQMAAAIAETEGRAGLYFANVEREAEPGKISLWEQAHFEIDEPYELIADGAGWFLLPRQPAMLQASVVERALYLSLGGCSPQLRTREDTHLFLRLGLGRPVCAVRNVGAFLTADANDTGRLTLDHDKASENYARATVHLYDDVLVKQQAVARASVHVLQHRSARASIHLAELAVRRRPLAAARHLAKATRTSPRTVFDGVLSRLGVRRQPTHW